MRFITLFILFFSGFALHAAELAHINVSPKQIQALGVRAQTLQDSQSVASVGLPARVDLPAKAQRMVAAPLSGLILTVNKAVGDPVRAGETLATLSSTGLVDAQRQLMMAATRTRLARENAARDQRLFDEGVISESRLRMTQAEATIASAEDRAARASLKLYGVSGAAATRMANGGAMLDQIALAAPIGGVLLEATAAAGSRVEAGMPLFKLGNLTRLALDIQVTPTQAATLRAGQMVTVTGTAASGKILRVAPAVSNAQTLSVRAEVGDPQQQLRPGQMVEVRISTTAVAGQYRVPSSALLWQARAPHLFVEMPGGYRLVPVQVHAQSAESASVSASPPGALKDGDRVATSGVAALKSLLSAE
ncbi:MAG: efflux RND transporter periplasmic adaptor subunit [Thiobacillaceae bacterium]